MNRDELIKRLEELDPSDAYHKGVEFDARSYYAAIQSRPVHAACGRAAGRSHE